MKHENEITQQHKTDDMSLKQSNRYKISNTELSDDITSTLVLILDL